MIASLYEPPCTQAPPEELPRRWAELAELLGRCERSLRDELSRYTLPLGLSQAQFALLWACRYAPAEGLSQNELAVNLALSPAHVSGQVEQLRAKGWLVGQRRAPDRRKQVWQLTGEGDARLAELLSALIDWAAKLEHRLPAERREALAGLLEGLVLALTPCASKPEDLASAAHSNN